ncbi:aldehyde dehydrogenase family protein [Burkholderia multivorans]|uniref:aldehyde dehydrogenase family protein n=1 Tax=Burkholderia multivorans TaxID=87883 RepID=UPI000D009F37|nr:aldehyde dehydrogenase family protein [Burkholderia multivorans]MBU9312549.1 aldehyde dehydrogenase family protein [Burkholderia multivorans]MCA8250723.1 aldehyde dehydrogenase family protein [Burkholderia multivorans]MCA8457322.1 aldehyde dehydrogenase family protein [Burkholderia multivorans]MDN7870396.1 aldehyde dehydrogenase family protein [Burkholderia multivorans]PRE28507.1 aldehyde dehydrogenase family protein [Burkholderia multivorans]
MTQKPNLIGGTWADGSNTIESINPSDTRDIVGHYAMADEAQMRAAVAAAREAQPGWAATTTQTRSDLLLKTSIELAARKEEIGELVSREAGKTRAEGIGEVIRASQIFQFFAGEAVRYGGENLPSVRPNINVQISRDPVGVVALITPWNFPIAIAAWKLAPALAFGNAAVLKPSEETPGVAWELFRVLERNGLPPGVANLVNGRGADAGAALVEGVDAISFTGSVRTGRRLAQSAVANMIRIQLEMGGKNPLVVLDDADLATAVECAVNGSYFSAGQRCTASSRLIVTEGIHDRFVDALRHRMRALKVGHALESGTDIGPLINQRQLDTVQRYIQTGREEGAELVEGGQLLQRETPGFYMQPALLTATANDMRINREEVFGPFAAVIRAADYDEALALANDTEFGLSAGICTTSHRHASHFRQNIRSGLAMVNLPTAGLDYHVPFGGTKASSYGQREQGAYAVDFYTNTKTAYVGH